MKVLFAFSVLFIACSAESQAEEIIRYRARISEADHHNSRGERLERVEQTLRQDRANFHKGTHRDPEDQGEQLFSKPENREWLERLATSATIAPALRDFLLHQTPVVEVRITKDSGSGAMKMEIFDVRNLEDPSMTKKEGPKMTYRELFRMLSFVPAATAESVEAGAHEDAIYPPVIPQFRGDDEIIRVMPKKVARASHAALTHDGNRVLLESAPGVVELWDLETNHLVFSHRISSSRLGCITRAAEPGWMLVAASHIYRIPVLSGKEPEFLFSGYSHPENEKPQFYTGGIRPGRKNGELLVEALDFGRGMEPSDGKLAKLYPEQGLLELVDGTDIPISSLDNGQAIGSLDIGEGTITSGRLLDRLGSRELIAMTGPDPEWLKKDEWSWGGLWEPRWNEKENFQLYIRDSIESALRRVGSDSPLVTLQGISPSGSRMLVRLAMPNHDAPQELPPFLGDWILGSDWDIEFFSIVEVDLRTLETSTLQISGNEIVGTYTENGEYILGELRRDAKYWEITRLDSKKNLMQSGLRVPAGRFTPKANTSAIREYAPNSFELSFSDLDRCDPSCKHSTHAGLGGGRYSVSFRLENGTVSKVDNSGCRVVARGAGGATATFVESQSGGYFGTLRFDTISGKGKLVTGIAADRYNARGLLEWGTFDGDRHLSAFSPSGNRFFLTKSGAQGNVGEHFQILDLTASQELNALERYLEYIAGEAFTWHGEDHVIFSTESQIGTFSAINENSEPPVMIPNQPGSPPNRALYDETRGWTGFSRDNAVDFYSLDSNHAAVHELSIYFNSTGELTVVDRDGFFTGHSRDGAACSMVRNGKTFPFEQFDLLKNRPDLILARLGAEESLIEAAEVLRAERIRKSGFSEESLGISSDAPEVELLGEVPLTTADSSIVIEISVTSRTEELERVMVYSNGVPVHGSDGIDLSEQQASRWTGEVKVPLLPGENRIEIRALDGRGTESLAEARSIESTADGNPRLYVAALGVSQYRQSEFNLDVAAKDAEDITAYFQENDSDQWKSVETLCLTDEQVTKGAIVAVERFFSQAKPEDVAVLFIAGHGLLDESYDYYFATSEIDFENPGPTGGLKFDEIESVFYRCSALRKLGLIDTCHAGELVGGTSEEILALLKKNGVRAKELPNLPKKTGLAEISFEERRIVSEFFADLRRGSGATIIAASAGAEFSNEDKDLGNGIFTHLVLESLADKEGDENADGVIDVRELRKYVEVEASRMTGGLQNPSTRRLNFVNPFVISR